MATRLERDGRDDALTSLPSRTVLLDRHDDAVAQASQRGARVAVVLCDLDNFRLINQSQVHAVGDELLMAVARRFEAVLRAGTLVTRLGDEFVVLLDDVRAVSDVMRIAERLLRALQEPVVLAERDWHVTTSIGIAVGAAGPQLAEDLLRDADTALSRAKHDGKDRYALFDPTMRAVVTQRLDLEHDLRRAIQRGELRLVYQPQVALDSGEIVGFEALVRWQHPIRGLISPAEFVPVAEDSGLIIPLGHWVLRHACWTAQRWRAQHPELVIAVNLSARQFRHPTLYDDVVSAISETGLPAHALVLEITESTAMDDSAASTRTLANLRAHGVRLAIDDFGTGYSSLAQLKRLPVACLKIDRAFIAGLGESADDEMIVAAIIGLAHAMGLCVIAEGVETAWQYERLRALGCDWAQGYLLAPPLAPEVVPGILEAPRAAAAMSVPSSSV
ncbi:MAG TPA: bifunctional diguanylate cyclase/phosphodiesterase [Thermomicrobiales bacterium]|nr:bifunctional diguanylate cyclase/phosphodiesterase [Thermomicrobiales bacterium]